jgi:hypothetical protein
LIARNRRTAVDLDRAVAIEQRPVGPLLAHAGERMRGPGPGFFARTRERLRGRARREAGRALAGRACVRARASGPAEPLATEENSALFQFPESPFQ